MTSSPKRTRSGRGRRTDLVPVLPPTGDGTRSGTPGRGDLVPAKRTRSTEQLELFSRWDDGLSWDEWFRNLPLGPEGQR
jgi:hypothetical protein